MFTGGVKVAIFAELRAAENRGKYLGSQSVRGSFVVFAECPQGCVQNAHIGPEVCNPFPGREFASPLLYLSPPEPLTRACPPSATASRLPRNTLQIFMRQHARNPRVLPNSIS